MSRLRSAVVIGIGLSVATGVVFADNVLADVESDHGRLGEVGARSEGDR